MKHKPWRAADAAAAAGRRRRRPDQNHNIPEISNFGDIIMGKWAKPDLSDLENDLLNNSMKSISWQLINIIPKKLCTKNKEKLSNRFWENWQKVANSQIWPFFNLSNLEKWPLEWFNQIHLSAVHQHPPWEASWQNREKVIKQFLRKLPPNGKWAKFDLSDL